MTCISPPELADVQILAFLDGQPDRDVEAHMKQCPHCRERATTLASFQGRMTTHLYRLTCPSSRELGEYHLGMLDGAATASVRLHLMECPHCSQELAQLTTFLNKLAPDVEFSLREKVRVLVAQLVGGGGQGDRPKSFVMAQVGVGVRGEPEGPRVYQADDIQIAIGTQADPQMPGSQVLLVLITGAETSDWQANLWQANHLIATAAVDELGNAVVSGLPPGLYDLVLTGQEVEIRIPSVQV